MNAVTRLAVGYSKIKKCEEKAERQDLGMMTIDVGPTIVTKKLLVSKNILPADIIKNSP